MTTCTHKCFAVVIAAAGLWATAHAEGLTADDCWGRAWQAASEISSAHDAGRIKAQVAARAAVANQKDLLRKWGEGEAVVWVKASCEVARAYAEALHGTPERHQELLQESVRLAKTLDEWDQARLTKPTLKTFVAGLWQRDQDLAALTRWVAEDEINRMPAALQFFSDWLTLLQSKTQDDITQDHTIADILDLTMTHNRKFAPNERLQLLARVAPFLKNTTWRQPLLDEFAVVEADSNSLDFESILTISRIESGLGAIDKADARITRAGQMLQASDTGDCLAPWACLAEAKRAAGKDKNEIEAAFDTGITRADERPGFLKKIAEALTWCARAPLRETPTLEL